MFGQWFKPREWLWFFFRLMCGKQALETNFHTQQLCHAKYEVVLRKSCLAPKQWWLWFKYTSLFSCQSIMGSSQSPSTSIHWNKNNRFMRGVVQPPWHQTCWNTGTAPIENISIEANKEGFVERERKRANFHPSAEPANHWVTSVGYLESYKKEEGWVQMSHHLTTPL